jgi:hypothetical protein
MDLEEFKQRLERVYASIGQRVDSDFRNLTISFEPTSNEGGTIVISFDSKDKADVLNRIFLIISNLAKLKDHLKRRVSLIGGNPAVIEAEVDASEYLSIIIDLDNAEKHGPRKESRSGKFPIITNPGTGLGINHPGEISSSGSFAINPFTGEFHSQNMNIGITAEIRDKNDHIIYRFEELTDKAVQA